MASAVKTVAGGSGGVVDDGYCVTCSKSFSGKRGLGVHRKRAHPAEHNVSTVVSTVPGSYRGVDQLET